MPNDGRIFVEPYGWVTPVRNLRGVIQYYIDSSGARVGDPITGPGRGERISPTAARTQAAARAKRQRELPEQAAVQALNDDVVWVDGKRMRFASSQQNPDGSFTVTYDNGKPEPYFKPSAFDALDSVDPDSQFVMSHGPRVNADGQSMALSDAFKSGGGLAGMLGKLGATGTNRMTVGSGLSWLASLSVKDPEAYAEMVDKLHGAKYLSDSEYAAAGGGYSIDVGNAFAKAATETAVINGTDAGANMTLNEFLAKKQGANAGTDYERVERKFTDPAALAQTARAAAQDLLGRALTPDEEKRFTSKFRGLETGFYDGIDSGRRDKTAATVTDPNPAGQADAFARSPEFDADRTKQLTGEYMDVLQQLFGGD